MRSKRLAAVVGVCVSLAMASGIDAGGITSCPYDCCDNNGIVDVPDLLELLSQWGEFGVSCDMNGDGVDLTDFLMLLANWGPCP